MKAKLERFLVLLINSWRDSTTSIFWVKTGNSYQHQSQEDNNDDEKWVSQYMHVCVWVCVCVSVCMCVCVWVECEKK